MPKLDGILETAIHTEDVARSRAFYEGALGLEQIYSDDRLTAYAVARRDVLLVFRKDATGQTVIPPSGSRPWRRWRLAMWHSPPARKNSTAGKRISLRVGSSSRREML